MKNLKKLFVVLPLVLVMLLSVVPVLAQPVAEGKKDDALFQTILNNTKFTEEDGLYFLNTKGMEMPIWVGENKPFADSGIDYGTNLKVVLLKGGAVHGWVKANPDAVAPLQVAQSYVANNMPEYNIPSYQILNVLRVDKTVMVPETWLDEKSQPSKSSTPKVVEGDIVFVNEDGTEGEKVPEEWTENIRWQGWKEDKENADLEVRTGTLSMTQGKTNIKFNVKQTRKFEIVEENAADPTKLVEAHVKGLLIVVEESNLPVAITHHFVFADGTEIVQTSEQKWAKNAGELAIATVNPAWYMTVPGFTIDTTKTAVAGVYDEDNYLVLGEKVLKSYKVDLYYTAGEGADKDQVDAALAGNAANVANAQQLPATGAADSFALVLSSLALVVVGLFFKK